MLPSPEQVANSAARMWSRSEIEHSTLYLLGMSRSLRSAAEANELEAERYVRKAEQLELEFSPLAALLEHEWTEIAGSDLPELTLYLVTCQSETQIAESLSMPLAFVFAGAERMRALSLSLVESGVDLSPRGSSAAELDG